MLLFRKEHLILVNDNNMKYITNKQRIFFRLTLNQLTKIL